jgi:8-oxo-dGTP pyrophosphatase MutT (NUDIX family)
MTAAAQPYIDRWNRPVMPGPDARYKGREGIFAVMITRGHLLVSWSKAAPHTAELPGGGIEKGEDLAAALTREIEEETAVQLKVTDPSRAFAQTVHYYADNSDEFWDYDQTFWQLDQKDCDAAWFDGERQPTDALKSAWVPLGQLEDLPFHAMHRRALAHFGVAW